MEKDFIKRLQRFKAKRKLEGELQSLEGEELEKKVARAQRWLFIDNLLYAILHLCALIPFLPLSFAVFCIFARTLQAIGFAVNPPSLESIYPHVPYVGVASLAIFFITLIVSALISDKVTEAETFLEELERKEHYSLKKRLRKELAKIEKQADKLLNEIARYEKKSKTYNP